jgi:hypothetical protein
MQTRTKLVWLELIGGVLGWLWILASLGAIYLVSTAAENLSLLAAENCARLLR